jgi:hypothetical protein
VPAGRRNDKCLEGFTGGYLQSEVEHAFLRRPGTPAHATVWPPPRRITVLRPGPGLVPPAGAQPGGEWSPRADMVELEAEQVRAAPAFAPTAPLNALHAPPQTLRLRISAVFPLLSTALNLSSSLPLFPRSCSLHFTCPTSVPSSHHRILQI